MSMHKPSDQWRIGLTLALTTACFWATLPVALKIALEQLDVMTLTWARFAFAALVVAIWLGARGKFAKYRGLPTRTWWLLLLAGLGLIGNYVFYLLGLAYTTPANAQLLIQTAPLLMALGGIFVFKESFNGGQWFGLLAITLGLLMFFSDQLVQPTMGDQYILGVLSILLAAVVWAVYALIQKQLLMRLSATHVLWIIYFLASIVLLPFSQPQKLLELDAFHALILLYCAINTLGAYGAFAEALAHWEASRVSAVLALTPLLTVATVELCHFIWPHLVSRETITTWGWIGAALVVSGSMLTSLLKRKPARV